MVIIDFQAQRYKKKRKKERMRKKKELTGISCGLFMCLPNGAGIT
jgi:hypothetical protein